MTTDKLVRIPAHLVARIELRQHKGQTIAGVIEEALDIVDKFSPLPKPPEPTQIPPKPRDPTLLDGDRRIEPLAIIETFDKKDANNG